MGRSNFALSWSVSLMPLMALSTLCPSLDIATRSESFKISRIQKNVRFVTQELFQNKSYELLHGHFIRSAQDLITPKSESSTYQSSRGQSLEDVPLRPGR